MENSLFVLGNLLLDMVVSVEDGYLEANNLKPDSIQTAKGNRLQIYTEILNRKDVVLSPGGSALNTVRMAQTILKARNSITLLGAVGSDETGKLLVETVEKEGIKMLVQFVESTPTGRCACLLTNGGAARTMITDLGAALKFSHETWMESANDFTYLDNSKFVYISGYFLKVSPATAMEVVRNVKRRNVPVLLNLNAVWVTTSCKQEIIAMLPFVDVLFGNEAEITSFVKELNLKFPSDSPSVINDTAQVASALSSFILEKKREFSDEEQSLMPTFNNLVLMTRGEKPVICSENGKSKEYPVPFVSREDIVDSTGAGDAFVGGFLASYIQGKSVDDCIACGLWAATEELKGYGFILPSEIPQQFQSR